MGSTIITTTTKLNLKKKTAPKKISARTKAEKVPAAGFGGAVQAAKTDHLPDLSKFTGSSALNVKLDYDGIADAWPAVDPGMIPFGSRVLVQMRKPKARTAGGILLPDEAKDTVAWNTQVARVVSLGPVAFSDRKTLAQWPEGKWVQPGDFVRAPKYGGDRWQVTDAEGNEIQFAIFNDLELIGKVTGDPLKMKAFV